MWEKLLFTVLCFGIVYFILRIITMILAPKQTLFSGIKLGRIIARVRNGRNIRYYAHLKGLTGELERNDGTVYNGPVHIDERTGIILPGKEDIFSLWWYFFGVRFIGLDSIRQYPIRVAILDSKGKIIGSKVMMAKSLHFSDVYYLTGEDQETSEGVKGNLEFALTLQATNAAEALKYTDWFGKVQPSALAVSKDYVTGKTVREMLADRSELSDSPASFVNTMKVLNNDRVGNISLHRQVGMRVTAANVTQIRFDDVVAKALEAREIAMEQGGALVEQERLAANAKIQKVRGERSEENMKTQVMRKRAAIFAGAGGDRLAATEQTRLTADAIKEHSGTLVLNSPALPTVSTT